MSERGAKRGVGGAPFYAPPRRKTSAEIISEARAAVYGDMNSASNGSSGGVVRPIRTRRPFTPREPQRTLFTERVRKKETRPPSAFDLKFLSVSESDESLVASGARVASLDDDEFNGVLLTEPQGHAKKKPVLRNQSRSVQERSGDGWGGFPKLPHLSGRSKPLHRRNTSHAHSDEANTETDLAETISVTRPFSKGYEYQESISENGTNSLSPEAGGGGVRKKRFQTTKSVSCDSGNILTEIPVKHLAVQLPNTSSKHNSMSLLELSEALNQRNEDTDCTVRLMEALQKILEKSTPGNNLRDLVLRSLYMHIDSDDERILVAIARAMLTMRVTGTHLAAACKLVFKIARNDKNDHFFRNTDLLELLVEGCGRADPVSEGECCVYGAGALRFLALEPSLCALALRAGALHLAALHLKILNNAKAENPRLVSEQSTHALYQLTGALRNLAGGGERAARAFVASGALAELLAALQHHTDRDVLTNVARCLSVLSADETCCEWLCEAAASGGARSLLLALAACASRAPLAVRLAYTLGNMAAAHEQARISIYNEDGSIDVLLTILETYAIRNDNDTRDPDSDPDLHLIGTDLGGSDGSNEDVLIKTVRVVANLCLAERAGRGLAETHAERTVRSLLACLKLAETPLEETIPKNKAEVMRHSERHEELATAALATLNNITFYREPPEPDPLEEPLDQLCIATCGWLRSASNGTRTGAGCEAVRALGNLSRAHMLARRIVLEGAIDHLPAYLEHEDVSVRCAAAGVLVNVCGAGASRESAEATRVCAAALSAAAADRDAHSAALLARALWNAHSHTPLSAAQAHQATTALALFIDDESVFAACEALKGGERRASNPEITRQHVKFNLDNNNYEDENLHEARGKPFFVKAYSVDQELHLGHISDEDLNGTSGEDLGFEEGDLLGESECECGPCRRLAAWEELVGVAIPLLEKLRPTTADASVGTD